MDILNDMKERERGDSDTKRWVCMARTENNLCTNVLVQKLDYVMFSTEFHNYFPLVKEFYPSFTGLSSSFIYF